MSTNSIPTTSEREGEGELDERDRLFNAYLEDDLSDDKREDFEERIERDEAFREAYQKFTEVVDGVRNLPDKSAPPDLSGRIRTRIRVRSRGGFFADPAFRRQRVPYEVVAGAMMVVMASIYLLAGTPSARRLQYADQKRLDVPGPMRDEASRSPGAADHANRGD